jgi:hypothetical protein
MAEGEHASSLIGFGSERVGSAVLFRVRRGGARQAAAYARRVHRTATALLAARDADSVARRSEIAGREVRNTELRPDRH